MSGYPGEDFMAAGYGGSFEPYGSADAAEAEAGLANMPQAQPYTDPESFYDDPNGYVAGLVDNELDTRGLLPAEEDYYDEQAEAAEALEALREERAFGPLLENEIAEAIGYRPGHEEVAALLAPDVAGIAEAAHVELLAEMVSQGLSTEAAQEQMAADPHYHSALFTVATQEARRQRGLDDALAQVGRAQADQADPEYAAQMRRRDAGWQV